MKPWVAVAVALAACKGGGEARKVCAEAGEKYVRCVQEILGPEAAAFARSKDGVAECTRDDKTVQMYKQCLPVADCTQFMACAEDYARDSLPVIAPGPRKQQCAQYVADGLRGVAAQLVVVNELVKRDDAARSMAQACTLDESRPWADCIDPAERDMVKRYGVQRQAECEAWEPALAACILRQPGAKDCDPDSYPLWRTPRETGPAGPKVAWSIDANYDYEHLVEEAFVGWGPAHTLIIKDHDRLRAVRDGKVLWSVQDRSGSFAIAGGSVVATSEGLRGLRIWNAESGATSQVLGDQTVDGVGVVGERVLVQTGDQGLYEVTPAKCAKPACAKKLAVIAGEWAYATSTLGAWRGDLVIVSTSTASVAVVDRRGKKKFEIRMSDATELLIAGEDVIVSDDKGVAILSLPACSKQGPAVYVPTTRYRGEATELPGDCPTCILARPGCVIAQWDGGSVTPPSATKASSSARTSSVWMVPPGPWSAMSMARSPAMTSTSTPARSDLTGRAPCRCSRSIAPPLASPGRPSSR